MNINPYAPPKVDAAAVEEEQDWDNYKDASKARRFVNLIIDYFALVILILASVIILDIYEIKPRDGEMQILGAANMILYYLFFEAIFAATPGKWITRTRVVTYDGTKLRFSHILRRTLARFVPFEALTFVGRARGFHDRWSRTRVIRL